MQSLKNLFGWNQPRFTGEGKQHPLRIEHKGATLTAEELGMLVQEAIMISVERLQSRDNACRFAFPDPLKPATEALFFVRAQRVESAGEARNLNWGNILATIKASRTTYTGMHFSVANIK